VAEGRRSSFGADLKAVLAERDFRKLFATRLVSQTGDGILTAAVGTYVFFNASTFPSPEAGAAAFAVLYLPYSLIGPFAGVLIDRWSRRQILVWSAPIRAALVLVTAALMVADNRSVPLYIAVLAVLGVSRFLLSSFSAALPHVTPAHKLVVANAVSDTSGGIMSALGGIVALGLNAATGDTERGAAVTMLVGGGCYVAASLVATIMPKDLLGPSEAHRRAVSLADDLVGVAAGLVDGARYVMKRRGPRTALGATGAFSFLFGPLFLMSILLYRNYFYPAQVTVAERHVGTLAVASALGYACAALITPSATRRLSKQAWIALMLVVAAVVAGTVGETFNQVGYLAIGFLMYLTRQSVAISTVTILQEDVEDVYRGRVFAFYDMLYNAAYAIGAALFAVFMAPDGKSPGVVAVAAAGFLVAAIAYWLSARRSPSGGSPADAPSAGGSPADAPSAGGSPAGASSGGRSPSADAQRSSS
jgi:MFS family permease